MTVAALLWRNTPIKLERSQLNLPLIVYLSNFGFATVMSLAAGFSIPVLLGLFLGAAPAVILWWKTQNTSTENVVESGTNQGQIAPVEVALK
jgi:uncharacterized membrane protein